MQTWNHPLMSDNITREDTNEVIKFLQQDPLPQLTHGPKVREFEEAWSKWVGKKYSVFVNSGSSANQLTMLAMKYLRGEGEIIVPPLTWVSDIASVMQNGFKPVFCDINFENLSFNLKQLKNLINEKTKAIFITHVLGLNGLTQELLDICEDRGITLIEDVCESHGATFQGKKLGSFGFLSNFSFYFAHHMSTIEGGMICTDNETFYQYLRAFRSHGMVREMTNQNLKDSIIAEYPSLNKDFIFLAPAYNFRSTEINAVLGLSQLKKLDKNNIKRQENFQHFINGLDKNKYFTDFNMEGQSNYAFIVILNPDILRRGTNSRKQTQILEETLTQNGIEFRRGLSGGGNQVEQPYMPKEIVEVSFLPNMKYIHQFSWYIGNYPELEKEKIDKLLSVLNSI
jgi:CDP-6-deoxy-D-xylo-4-hexulose-3-dehydrase